MKIPFTNEHSVYNLFCPSVCRSFFKGSNSLISILFIYDNGTMTFCFLTHFVRLSIHDFLYFANYGCCHPYFIFNLVYNIKLSNFKISLLVHQNIVVPLPNYFSILINLLCWLYCWLLLDLRQSFHLLNYHSLHQLIYLQRWLVVQLFFYTTMSVGFQKAKNHHV